MNELVGKRITRVVLSLDSRYMLFECEGEEPMCWVAEGDCCANAYFYQCDEFDVLAGHVVMSVTETEVTSTNSDEWSYTDTSFIAIKTIKGCAKIEFRVEHNGYYGGRPVRCSTAYVDAMARVLAEVAA